MVIVIDRPSPIRYQVGSARFRFCVRLVTNDIDALTHAGIWRNLGREGTWDQAQFLSGRSFRYCTNEISGILSCTSAPSAP